MLIYPDLLTISAKDLFIFVHYILDGYVKNWASCTFNYEQG